MRRQRNDYEHIEQVKLFNWAKEKERLHLHLSLLFAIPNGGHRHKAVGAKLKSGGVKAGVPDCFLAVPKNGKHGLFLEPCSPRSSPLTPPRFSILGTAVRRCFCIENNCLEGS